jgi:Fibronectin type III domain
MVSLRQQQKIMNNYHVSLRFRRLSNAALAVFAAVVIKGMTDNPAFPNPPVSLAEVADLLARFRAASQAAMGGGLVLTAARNAARVALMDALYQLASYVRGTALHDVTLLLSSGFEAASKNRVQSPLSQPAILAVENERSGALLVRVGPLSNARGYEVQINMGDGPWQDLGIFPQARRIELTNLTPGMVYGIRVRAIGGSTGYSDWSNPTAHRSL